MPNATFMLELSEPTSGEPSHMDAQDNSIIENLQSQVQALQAELYHTRQIVEVLMQQDRLAITEWSRDFELRRWNKGAEALYGYTFEELAPKGRDAFFMMVPPRQQPFVEKIISTVFEINPPAFPTINSNIRKDGEQIEVEYHHFPVLGADGQVESLLIISSDVTELQQYQKDLRISENRYRSIIETIEDGYYETDLRGNVTFSNEAFSKIIELAYEEIPTVTYQNFLAPEDSQRVFEVFNRVYTTQQSQKSVELAFLHDGGAIRYADVSVGLRRDVNGEILGFQGIVRDITERKQAENNLAEQNRLLENINTLVLASYENIPELELMNATARIACQTLNATSAYIIFWNNGSHQVVGEYISGAANILEQQSDLGESYDFVTRILSVTPSPITITF